MEILTRCVKETADLGQSLAKDFKGGEILALTGGLGAGKTAFAKGIALGLGITETVSSPTFAILNVYRGRLTLCHYDAYRLGGAVEATESGLDEYFGNKNCVCVIEWADNIEELLENHSVIDVNIRVISKNTREIRIDNK